MDFKTQLVALHACTEAREWVGDKDLATAWATCPRGDWLLWLAYMSGVSPQSVALAKCACARTALKYLPRREKRPLKAIQVTERWAVGQASDAERQDAAYAATAAATATYAAAATAAYAAAATTNAAATAATAAYAAAAATNAATAAATAAATNATNAAYAAAATNAAHAAHAAHADTDTASRSKSLRKCARLVRGHITASMVSDALSKRTAK